MKKIQISACAIAVAGVLIPTLSHADCYDWPLRQRYTSNPQSVAYDGDTIYITMPGLPAAISKMSVRVNGIDTPEIRGECETEKVRAKEAKAFLIDRLLGAETILFCNPAWGKYAGRVLADVQIDGEDLVEMMSAAGHGRPYDGGERQGWCS